MKKIGFILATLFLLAFQIPSVFAAGSIDCPAPPPAIGSCPSNYPHYYKATGDSEMACNLTLTCLAGQNFDCYGGSQCYTPTTGGGPTSVCNGGYNYGTAGAPICGEQLSLFRNPLTSSILDIVSSTLNILGKVVYLPQGVACTTGQTIAWDGTNSKWYCTLEGLWRYTIASTTKINYTVPTNNAQVGINMADPGAYTLNVNGNTNITGSLTIGGDKKFAIAQFVGLTTGTYNGSDGGSTGYANADARCSGQYTGGHICRPDDIIFSYVNGNPGSILTTNGSAWVNNGPPGFWQFATNDCSGWNNGTSTDILGSVFDFTNKKFLVTPCNLSRKFACCK